MAQFKIGGPVVKIDSDAHGTVIALRSGRGRVIYTVLFGDGTQSTVLVPDLRADFDVSNPFERCKSGIFSSYSDYSKKNTYDQELQQFHYLVTQSAATLFRAYISSHC